MALKFGDVPEIDNTVGFDDVNLNGFVPDVADTSVTLKLVSVPYVLLYEALNPVMVWLDLLIMTDDVTCGAAL